MKKTILLLWGLICILIFASCSKEQIKSATGSNSQGAAPGQAVVNGVTIPPTPPKGGGGSSIIQKGTGRTVVNEGSTIPPPPPKGGGGS